MTDHDSFSPELVLLIERYSALVAEVARKVTRRRADLVEDDIAQEVTIALWRQLQHERVIEQPTSYIYKAVVRETARAIRREQVRRERDAGALGTAVGPSPHDDYEARRQRGALRASLAGLSPERRRAVGSHLMGFSINEIGQRFAWPYVKTRNLVTRGMVDLRRLLRERGVK